MAQTQDTTPMQNATPVQLPRIVKRRMVEIERCKHITRKGEHCERLARYNDGAKCSIHALKRLVTFVTCKAEGCECQTWSKYGLCRKHCTAARARDCRAAKAARDGDEEQEEEAA